MSKEQKADKKVQTGPSATIYGVPFYSIGQADTFPNDDLAFLMSVASTLTVDATLPFLGPPEASAVERDKNQRVLAVVINNMKVRKALLSVAVTARWLFSERVICLPGKSYLGLPQLISRHESGVLTSAGPVTGAVLSELLSTIFAKTIMKIVKSSNTTASDLKKLAKSFIAVHNDPVAGRNEEWKATFAADVAVSLRVSKVDEARALLKKQNTPASVINCLADLQEISMKNLSVEQRILILPSGPFGLFVSDLASFFPGSPINEALFNSLSFYESDLDHLSLKAIKSVVATDRFLVTDQKAGGSYWRNLVRFNSPIVVYSGEKAELNAAPSAGGNKKKKAKQEDVRVKSFPAEVIVKLLDASGTLKKAQEVHKVEKIPEAVEDCAL